MIYIYIVFSVPVLLADEPVLVIDEFNFTNDVALLPLTELKL